MTAMVTESRKETQADTPWRRFRRLLRQYFWLWIAYQTVKGSLTLALIWLPIWWTMTG